MPSYLYTAKHIRTGKPQTGEAEAQNESALAQELRKQDLIVTSVHRSQSRESTKVPFMNFFVHVPLKEKMIFARNLGVMVGSGLPISRAIANLGSQISNRNLKKILQNVSTDLEKGNSLSASLEKFPSVFDELFVNMVRVGEEGGSLEEVLNIIAVQLEKEHQLISKVRGALIYPSVILFAMVLVAIVMLTYVLPQITGVFEDMEVELPATTQFIISISDFLQHYFLFVIVGFFAFLLFLRLTWNVDFFRKVRSMIATRLFIVGPIIVKVNSARFSRILSSLLRSGVPLVRSLEIIQNTLTNYFYHRALGEAVEQIQKGVALSTVIKKYSHLFPVLVPQMLEVGENTGKTEAVMQKLASFYEEEVDQITKNLSSIVEPVLMLLIGTAVGFFAVSMLQPMYSVLENIQ